MTDRDPAEGFYTKRERKRAMRRERDLENERLRLEEWERQTANLDPFEKRLYPDWRSIGRYRESKARIEHEDDHRFIRRMRKATEAEVVIKDIDPIPLEKG